MPVKTLLHLAGAKIPFQSLETMEFEKKSVIHEELSPFLKRFHLTRSRPLDSLCDCGWGGHCLCYYKEIRQDQIDQFWAEESDYQYLGDFLQFP